MKEKKTIYLDKETSKDFKIMCACIGSNMSVEIEKLVKEEVEKWKKTGK